MLPGASTSLYRIWRLAPPLVLSREIGHLRTLRLVPATLVVAMLVLPRTWFFRLVLASLSPTWSPVPALHTAVVPHTVLA